MDFTISNALEKLNKSTEDEQYINILIEYINNQEDTINKLKTEIADANHDLENYCSNCKLKQTCNDIVEEEYRCSKACLRYTNSKIIKEVLNHELLYGDY